MTTPSDLFATFAIVSIAIISVIVAFAGALWLILIILDECDQRVEVIRSRWQTRRRAKQ